MDTRLNEAETGEFSKHGVADHGAYGGFLMLRKAARPIMCMLIVLALAQGALAASSAGVLFLRIGAGVRAAGMGEAFVAVADDATATHWNPAGLGQYPLFDAWTAVPLPSGSKIDDAICVRNISLGEGTPTYDAWILSDGRLLRYSANRWEQDIALPPEVTTVTHLATSGEELWIATNRGLFRGDNLIWKPVVPPTDDGWGVETINDLQLTSGPRTWLATDDGVKVYDGHEWLHYGVELGLPSNRVLMVHFVNSRLGWAVTDSGLVAFDGESFDVAEPVSALIGQSVADVARKYIGSDDAVRISKAAEVIRELNHLDGDEIAPGSTVRIPYALAFESAITSITKDAKNRLWVGTEQGLKLYDGQKWQSFGYRPYTPEESIELAVMAERYLGAGTSPERIQAFVDWTVRYNGLAADEPVAAGHTIYLYSGPAAAPISSLMSSGSDIYIGTPYGFLLFNDDSWGRIYHEALDYADAVAIDIAGRDPCFFARDRIVWHERARSQASAMFVKWLPNLAPDMYYAYGSLVTHARGVGTIGFNAKVLSYGKVDRTESNPNVTDSFWPVDFSLGLSYGAKLNSRLAAGLTAKFIYSSLSPLGAGAELGNGTATAFGLDVGLLYKTPLKRLTIGAALTNLGPDVTYIDADQSDPLPRNLALGFAYKLIDAPFNRLTLATDLNKEVIDWGEDSATELKQIIYNVGLEYWYADAVALRVGYIYDEDGDIKTPTVGGGLVVKGMIIDLAYIPSVREDQVMANILRVSFTGVWN